MSKARTLVPGSVTLVDLAELYWDSPAVALHPDTKPGIDAAAMLAHAKGRAA